MILAWLGLTVNALARLGSDCRLFEYRIDSLGHGAGQRPQRSVLSLPILRPAASTLLVEWNDTGKTYTGDQLIHHCLKRTRGEVRAAALIMKIKRCLMASSMPSKSGGASLAAPGRRTDVLVGIAFERSLEISLGVLAISGGGAYVAARSRIPQSGFLYDDDSARLALLTQTALPRALRQLTHTPIID